MNLNEICPWLAKPEADDWTGCQDVNCAIWDAERQCCSFNTKARVKNVCEQTVLTRYKNRLKLNVNLLLGEKTGWGRIELKKRLTELIDGLNDEPSL